MSGSFLIKHMLKAVLGEVLKQVNLLENSGSWGWYPGSNSALPPEKAPWPGQMSTLKVALKP